MNSVARATQNELKSLFSNVSGKIGLSPGIVEKDFWVVWTLDYLFARSPWKIQLAALEADYRHMQNMIFGPRPTFSEILEMIRHLESEIHGML